MLGETGNYVFSKGNLVEFTKDQKKYLVVNQFSATIYNMVRAPAPGTHGPTAHQFKYICLYDKYARPIVFLDENLKLAPKEKIPRFLFWSQYYDVDTGLYYLFNSFWYHPG